jgi:hypothetical protein
MALSVARPISSSLLDRFSRSRCSNQGRCQECGMCNELNPINTRHIGEKKEILSDLKTPERSQFPQLEV